MRDYSEFLSDREIFVLQNHPAMSYKAIGDKLGISPERVRQIKVVAHHKIRGEKALEDAHARAEVPELLSLRRKDINLVLLALEELRRPVLTFRADQRRKKDSETVADLKTLDDLIVGLCDMLKST